MNALIRFFRTDNSWFKFITRVMVAVVIFPHGAQKLLGWFGGGGPGQTVDAFNSAFGLPAFITALIITTEFFGSLSILLGLVTRLSAFALSALMIGAILLVHAPNGIFMNWMGTQRGEGFEFHLLVLAISLPLMIFGAGRYSIDRVIARKLSEKYARTHQRDLDKVPSIPQHA